MALPAAETGGQVVEQPVVSVAVITYRQERYISQAMESVLMQRLSVPWEVVVGEDASPDATRDILLNIQKRWPDRIRLFLREKNVGATRNLYEVLFHCRGRYIALLEGDDYWTDPEKLQKQADFLESHPQYIACAHRCLFVDQQGNPTPDKRVNEWFFDGERYTYQQFQNREMPGQNGTLMMRNLFLNPRFDYRILYQAHPVVGDRTLHLLLSAQGDVYCMKDVMGCYRFVQQEGAPNWVARTQHQNLLDGRVGYLCALEEYSHSVLKLPLCFDKVKRDYYGQAFCKLLRHPTRDNLSVVRNILFMSPHKIRLFCYGVAHAIGSLPGVFRGKKTKGSR